MLPTAEPFLYTVSATVTEGATAAAVEDALLEELERVRAHGVTADELDRAKAQLEARFVFDDDSVTNIAHQLGYFQTVASVDVFHELAARVRAVTVESVADVARSMLRAANRTLGSFEPLPVAAA
jgi:zinc protease